MAPLVRHIAGALALLVILAMPVAADPTYPAFSAPVVDAANVLSDADKAEITQKLVDLQTKTGIQFAVATVPSLDGQEIEPYANGLFRNWKLGEKGVNNGLLLLVAPKEHRLRLEVGYGLEGTMTDLQTKLIQHNTMVPKLKAGDIVGAIKAGVDDSILVLTKDKASLPERLTKETDTNDTGDMILGFIIMFVIFAVVVVVIVRLSRGGSWGSWAIGSAIGSNWSSSDSSSSSGGDSFSGGGGGDSGGGGSSDSW